ncbi:hypothetical protein [Vulcanococcus sp.]|uniref:hypothetical protein n=1 Tax=Vulcanococcus sp. TaxID=2856995 RepID=UPI003C005951
MANRSATSAGVAGAIATLEAIAVTIWMRCGTTAATTSRAGAVVAVAPASTSAVDVTGHTHATDRHAARALVSALIGSRVPARS